MRLARTCRRRPVRRPGVPRAGRARRPRRMGPPGARRGTRGRGPRPAFSLASVLLPGAPEPFDPGLSFLAGRSFVDLRADADDPHAGPDLLRVLGVAPPEVPRPGVVRTGARTAASRRSARRMRPCSSGERTRPRACWRSCATGASSPCSAPRAAARARSCTPGSCPRCCERRDRGRSRTLTPGVAPTAALAAQLARATAGRRGLPASSSTTRAPWTSPPSAWPRGAAGARLLVVVDQFEEVFALDAGPRERRAFIDNLIYAATIPGGRTTVVLAMRADFYDRCAEHPELRALVAEHQFLVGPLGRPSCAGRSRSPPRSRASSWSRGWSAASSPTSRTTPAPCR